MTVPIAPSPDTGSVRSVERALDLLAALERTCHPVGVTELARMTGIPKATAQRLLSVLEGRGLIKKEWARYQLGPGVVPLARSFLSSDSIASAALPVVEHLAVTTGATAHLYARDRCNRVLLRRIDSSFPLRSGERVGERMPLYYGAPGRTLLAHLPQDEIDRCLASVELVPLANGNSMTRAELLARLEQIRRDGFAVSSSETRIGVVAICAPVFRGGLGVVASVGVSAPPSHMTPETMERLSIEVRQAAFQITEVCRGI